MDKDTLAYPQSLASSNDGFIYASYDWKNGAGMTIHQHYAGEAMKALIALYDKECRAKEAIAGKAVLYADAMIATYAEREK